MIFYSVSPFTTPYQEELGQRNHRYDNYRASWQEVARRLRHADGVLHTHFPRADSPDPGFEASSAAGLRTRGEVAVFELNPTRISPGGVVETVSGEIAVDAARLSAYDHGVAIVEFTWTATTPNFSAISTNLAQIHAQLLDLSRPLTTALMDKMVNFTHAAGIIADLPQHDAIRKLGKPMWTSGAMILADENLALDDALDWFDQQGLETCEVQEFCSHDRDQVAAWMRYAYRITDANATTAIDSVPLRAMRYCQYIYSAADTADDSLSHALGRSYDTVRPAKIASIRTHLSQSSNRLRVIEIEHSDLMKLLPPGERSSINRVLDHWEFETLVMKPAATKGEAAQNRLAELGDRSQRTANLFSEIILLAIALTSLFGTMLALAQYGRSMVADPTYSSYAQERGSLLDYVAGVSTNEMLIGTFLVCVVLSIGYVVVKLRQG